MEQQIQRYALGAAGAGFVVIWTTLGLTTAILALTTAVVATNTRRLRIAPRRRQQPARPRQRQTMRARPLREEDEALPLVPDEPSLIISATGF